MNIVKYFQDLILESEEQVGLFLGDGKIRESQDKNLNLGQIGISKPDEFGKAVNGLLRPEILASKDTEKDFFNADLQINVTSGEWLKKIYPHLQAKIDGLQLNDAEFLYFMWKKDSDISLNDVISFFRKVCGEVVENDINENDVLFLGNVDRRKKSDEEYVLYVAKIGTVEKNNFGILKRMSRNWRGMMNDYYSKGLSIKFGNKKQLERYFINNDEIFDSIPEKGDFIVPMVITGQMKKEAILKVVNQMSGTMGGAPFSAEDMVELGNMDVVIQIKDDNGDVQDSEEVEKTVYLIKLK